jgi:DNA polymerase III subunit gamma/tau
VCGGSLHAPEQVARWRPGDALGTRGAGSVLAARVGAVTQALYRRYRPATFAEVIGQAHVTGPLQQALAGDRTHHAYLFSGPRGCGKTTSARIMARCLNCAEGPTPTPCGECDSCLALAPGGGGSLDVIELDAATHGLVDDARDLRERAFFTPASSRYKVYIIDEAHMLTTNAANALLKIVEEPPPHVKFVFATTEPEKVIPTIRSRVHHYPFRLVPPGELATYLTQVCEKEGVTADRGAISLVVRAGRGSVRDAMSILDQLVSGAPDEGISYEYAAGLLGLTDATLLDDTVEAFAAGDPASVFRIVDRVVEAGHDPRRFTEDLLERLRDLVIIDAVPDAAGAILGDHPADELDRMRQQAAHFGAAELSRAADIVNTGLTEMRGATAPRLQLELICARVLLPAAESGARGLAARIDRLERRASIAGAPEEPVAGSAARAPAARRTPAAPRREQAAAAPSTPEPAGPAEPAASEPAASEAPAPPEPAEPSTASAAAGSAPEPADAGPAETTAPTAPAAAVPVDEPAAPTPEGGIDLVTLRREWPRVLEEIKTLRRYTWTLLSHNAQVAALEPGRMTLAMVNAGARDGFLRGGSDEIVREALVRVLGVDWKVDAIIDPSASPAPAAAPAPEPANEPPPSGRAAAQAAVAAEAARSTGEPGVEDAPSADDPDADDAALSHHDLLARELGAKVIGEYDAG